VLVLAGIALFVITTFVAQPFKVEQDSMYPTVQEGQYLLIDKLTPHVAGYSRGDIVIFNPIKRAACSDATGEPLPGSTPYIKRVVGEPGDHIELRDGHVYLNGATLDEPYAGDAQTGPPGLTWVVPDGRMFVMGDNRPGSIDSRFDTIGSICINDVIGKAFLRYWPLNRLGLFQSPAYGLVAAP